MTIFGAAPMTTANTDSAGTEPVPEQIEQPAAAPPGRAEMQTTAVPVATATAPAPIASKHAGGIEESLGLRLRAAREAKGLSCEAAAQALRLPVAIVQSLEAERFERIGHAIYLRGYLTKYLHLLDLPQVLAERVLQQRAVEPAPLVTARTVSRPRYLYDRYSGSMLYVILTGVIVVPAVLLAMRAGFDQNLVRVAPLDMPEQNTPVQAPRTENATATPGASTDKAAAPTAAGDAGPASFIASMAPFPQQAEPATKPEASAKAEPPPPAGEHRVRLGLAESSWVEIVAADGQKLEFGLLPAGSTRSYDSAKALDVRVGNANGATLEVDGKAKDIAPYRHSNVAHFRVSDGEIAAPRSGG